MKTKYLFAALCCVVMLSCQNNAPTLSGGGADLYEGVGKIVDTKSMDDGSEVMTDVNGNVITKDKDGNVTIVTPQNETIIIDNSINEDSSAPKDKWYNSTWQSLHKESPVPINPPERVPDFFTRILGYGFQVWQENVTKDSTIVEHHTYTEYLGKFRNTTAYLQQKDTNVQYTYTQENQYIKVSFVPGELGDGETRYELENWNGRVVLWENQYEYDYSLEEYVPVDRRMIDELENVYAPADNIIYFYQGSTTKDSRRELVSAKTKTTFYNYRRLSDVQIVASNNSGEYLLKEVEHEASETPELEVYELNGSGYCLLQLELISYR